MIIKLEVKNLYKIFSDNPEPAFRLLASGLSKEQIFEKMGLTVGVQNANLAIEEGEIFVIMGLSGSGKSTLVRLLNRLIEPTKGQIIIDSEDTSTITKTQLREVRRSKISMVFQSFALMPLLNIQENTAFGMELAGIPKKSVIKKYLKH
ncbi:glycine/betaine ABC transporter ATP-binding protein [Xenorhabdus vietnamensis]|uniref:Glycine/betaine ABC transporter ATP-binding protein n=1 Tax=Xenorhabdus vietnamensis TaxID=351656 RepID=A0A1Y2SH35_9GAMM|nr:glycine/betaine ABC transporter ATP-binding protein [Xenorhabdus vietnamensis]